MKKILFCPPHIASPCNCVALGFCHCSSFYIPYWKCEFRAWYTRLYANLCNRRTEVRGWLWLWSSLVAYIRYALYPLSICLFVGPDIILSIYYLSVYQKIHPHFVYPSDRFLLGLSSWLSTLCTTRLPVQLLMCLWIPFLPIYHIPWSHLSYNANRTGYLPVVYFCLKATTTFYRRFAAL